MSKRKNKRGGTNNGQNWNRGNGSNNNQSKNKGGERNFQKFVDTERVHNETNYWPQNNWCSDNRRAFDNSNVPTSSTGIHTWIRNRPANTLIIPQYINSNDQHKKDQQCRFPNNINNMQHSEKITSESSKETHRNNQENNVAMQHRETITRELSKETHKNNQENNVAKFANSEITTTNELNQCSESSDKPNVSTKLEQDKNKFKSEKKSSSSSSSSSESSSSESETERTKLTNETQRNNVENNVLKSVNTETTGSNELNALKSSIVNPTVSIKIKQEKDILTLKSEKKSSSSSSSSSSESSSSESEPVSSKKAKIIETSQKVKSATPSSPLNIKLRPLTDLVASTTPKTAQELKSVQATSSSSSSSDEEPSRPILITKTVEKEKPQALKTTKSKNKKVSSEDDVVCVGNLENKIVLEDESEESVADEDNESNKGSIILNNPSKKCEKNTSEKCMICDEKDHTSFQCQMICKNCSEPYHGYRTCPHPPNLNTMMQMFMEFCMQQMQNFQVDKHLSTSTCDSVPKPKVDATNITNTINKSNRLKRKQVITNDKKHRSSKKRKLSSSKKTRSKGNSDESSDNSDDVSDSSTESDENSSSSFVESLVSSKKKRKLKSKHSSKPANLLNSSSNPLNLPMVINGFPHLNMPTTSVQNPNTSANAFNTLFLTQMLQNAIQSLKK